MTLTMPTRRIVAFGDSITYGYGLSDCVGKTNNDPGFTASKKAWPQLLANRLGLTCINTSGPGASAKEVLFTVLNRKLSQADTVVITWPIPDRWCVFMPDRENIFFADRIGSWRTDKRTRSFYKYFASEYEVGIDLYQRMNYAKLHLDSLGVKNFHFISSSKDAEEFKWNKVSLPSLYLSEIRNDHPLALDNRHPGESAHKEYADLIYNHLQEDNK